MHESLAIRQHGSSLYSYASDLVVMELIHINYHGNHLKRIIPKFLNKVSDEINLNGIFVSTNSQLFLLLYYLFVVFIIKTFDIREAPKVMLISVTAIHCTAIPCGE